MPETTYFQRLTSLPKRVVILTICQGLFIFCAVGAVAIAPLVGRDLAPAPWMTTIPYGSQFLTVVAVAYATARFMDRFGRKPVFVIWALFAVAAGLTGFMAIKASSFLGLIVAHVFLGVFVSSANYYRYAAADNLRDDQRPLAVSLVISGGVVAAVAGPLLTLELGALFPNQTLAHSYLIIGLAGLLACGLLAAVKLPSRMGAQGGESQDADAGKLGASARSAIMIAGLSAAFGYFAMNLLMVQGTLLLDNQNVDSLLFTFAIQAHVFAMFAPSFVVGSVITRFGHVGVLYVGFGLLMLSCCFGLGLEHYGMILTSLILLGVAWNFLYVTGTSLISTKARNAAAFRIQGAAETVISLCAALGALLAGTLFSLLGWWLTATGIAAISLGLVVVITLVQHQPNRRSLYLYSGIIGSSDA